MVMQINQITTANNPDLVVQCKKESQSLVIDVAIPEDIIMFEEAKTNQV